MEKLPKKKIVVTGASGFIGKRLLALWESQYEVQSLSLRNIKMNELSLSGVDSIIHLAGKAHDMKSEETQPYFDINYNLTKALADQALVQGVPHFVFVSTVKVFGDAQVMELNEQTVCQPQDAYGKSKLAAEQYLQSIDKEEFKVAIVRPPMVYGPHAKGNVIKLIHLADKAYLLPFANIDNRRSVVFVDNLVALLARIIEQEARGVFIAGDAQPVSSSFLIQEIRKHLAPKGQLFTLPTFTRQAIRFLKPALYERLFGSFVVNNHHTNQQLHYTPPFTTEYGIEKMVEWYRDEVGSRKSEIGSGK